MKTTTNHGLKKPDGTDVVNIEDINYNADKIDGLLVPATTTANGLMSKDDKTKLNGIATGANNYTHPVTHPVSMISGLHAVATSGSYDELLNKPSTFPANGGNADTVDGVHFHPCNAAPLNSNSRPYFYAFNGGDDFNCYVKNTSNISVGNADKVGGAGLDSIARYYRYNNNININDTNIKEFYGTCVTQNASAPNTDWWHIINVPHSDNNGYGAQIALGYHGNAGLQVRSASGTSWGNWYDVIGNIELAKQMGGSSSSVCVLANTYGSLDMALALSTNASKAGNAEIKYQLGGWSASGGAVIVPTTGTYLCTLAGGLEVKSGSVNSSNGLNVGMGLVKNGSLISRLNPIFSDISTSGYGTKWHGLLAKHRYGNTFIVSLNAGDRLTFQGDLGSYYNNNPLTVSVRLSGYATLEKL